jgi:hypothetical protein
MDWTYKSVRSRGACRGGGYYSIPLLGFSFPPFPPNGCSKVLLSPVRSMYPNSALAEVSLIALTGFCGRPEYARHNMRSFQDANKVQPATAHEIAIDDKW